MTHEPFGLYVHIPFCSKICHYCDFAKTANFSDDHVSAYLRALTAQLAAWRRFIPTNQKFTSVFFGGGTPGILSREYSSLMKEILELAAPDAEITLESNPGNVTPENIATWRSLGFNRLSIGIQSFDPMGLKVLTRDHNLLEATRALDLAALHFPKSNGDLIYGWTGQTDESWLRDLETMCGTGVNHMSLYALTYEGNTPFARAQRRGAIQAASGDDLASRYDMACDVLRQNGFHHEEISNWSRYGGECEHNWLYWRGDKFICIGAGAHGFIDDGTQIGLRYSYPGDLRQFLKNADKYMTDTLEISKIVDLPALIIRATGGLIETERDLDSWLFEYVGCALRSREGVNLNHLESRGFRFTPNLMIQRALREGLLTRAADSLFASEAEWFRETAWSYEICESVHKQGSTSISNPSPI